MCPEPTVIRKAHPQPLWSTGDLAEIVSVLTEPQQELMSGFTAHKLLASDMDTLNTSYTTVYSIADLPYRTLYYLNLRLDILGSSLTWGWTIAKFRLSSAVTAYSCQDSYRMVKKFLWPIVKCQVAIYNWLSIALATHLTASSHVSLKCKLSCNCRSASARDSESGIYSHDAYACMQIYTYVMDMLWNVDNAL